MRTFKLTIEYDGVDFHGWQVQLNAQNTVQGELEAALSKNFKKKRVVVIGSGRTDKGVHARGQVAHFRMKTTMPTDELMRAINHNLPSGIVIKSVEEAEAGFHAQRSARGKSYSYTILNRSYPSALDRQRCYFFPRKINLGLMRSEARAFLGRHDFASFANVDHSRTCETIRTVRRLEIKKRGDFIVVTIEADGFLYKMVRNIVGTLLQVASGRFPSGSVKRMLKEKDRRSAGLAAPPEGLCLERVEY
ncbi:MAG: tRNA pseudouridine(38-40) synthase TruA [Candidatus Omnitrophica bacterium]|nr:tRNA pseudouridine(38-40) synthase TruA [Candidatus Omnitrophota bacterium]